MNPNSSQPMRFASSFDARQIGMGLLLVVACWLVPYSSSFAKGDCVLSNLTLTFGTINPQSISTVYTSGTAVVSCTGLQSNSIVSVCLAIDKGNAAGSTPAVRVISASGAGNQIPIVIKSSPSSPQEIGTGNPYPVAGPINFMSDVSGSGSAVFPISVAIQGPIAVAPLTYTNTFSGKDIEATFSEGVQSQCGNVLSRVAKGQLLIQATVIAGCAVSATAMDFGTISVLTSARSATSTITLNCTQGVTATISLDNGQTGTGPGTRLMRSGGFTTRYGIYQNSAHTLLWGQSIGVNTVNAPMGQSTSISVTAYGLVPSQATPVAGNYTDVVNVTITY